MKQQIKINQQTETPLVQHLDSFINDCKIRGMANDTITTYKSQLKLFIGFVGSKEVNTQLINEYILYMRSKGNNDITVRSKIKFVRNSKSPYTKEEIDILLKKPTRNSYTEYRNHAIVCFLLATGVRCRTLVNIKTKDINFTNNTIFLSTTKTGKQFYIPMSSTLKATLKHYLSLFEHEADDFLFMTLYGEQLARSSVKEAIRSYNLKRGVSKTSIHLFRNTFAINFLKNGGNLFTLKEILGHTDISTTQQYLKFSVDDMQDNFDDFCPLDTMKRKGIKLKKQKENDSYDRVIKKWTSSERYIFTK